MINKFQRIEKSIRLFLWVGESMSVVILTKQGQEQAQAEHAYINSFQHSSDNKDILMQYFNQIIKRLDEKNNQFISDQIAIFNAIGGEQGFQNIINKQHAGTTFQISSLKGNLINTTEIGIDQQLQNLLDTELQNEKEFQDYMLNAFLRLQQLTGQNIPEQKIGGLISSLRSKYLKSSAPLTNNNLLTILKNAKKEIGKNTKELKDKYHYLNTILSNLQNPVQIKQTSNGYEITSLDPQAQSIVKKVAPLMKDLITYFDSFQTDEIITKLNRWRTTTKGKLASKYASIVQELANLENKDAKQRKHLQEGLHQAIATTITKNTEKTSYEVSSSLRGNLWEISAAATYSPKKPIKKQISENPQVIQVLSENIGHLNKRPITTMVPVTVKEDKKTFYYKLNKDGKLVTTDKKELEEGEFLVKQISDRFKEADGKVDRIEGYDVKIGDQTTRYYIAYSDKFKQYSSLANLPVIGGTKPGTHEITTSPLNSNMELFTGNPLSNEVLFAILNKSKASYLNESMPSVQELEAYVSKLFLEMSFDPSGLEQSLNNSLIDKDFINSKNTLYVHSFGGGLMVPVFQTLEGMRMQASNILNYGNIISEIVSSSLSYGSVPTAVNDFMKMLEQAKPSDRWEWVASYVASSIQISVTLHLEQLLKLYNIIPL